MVIILRLAANPLSGLFYKKGEIGMTVANRSSNVPPFHNTANSRRKPGGATGVHNAAPRPFREVPAVQETLAICCRLCEAINHILVPCCKASIVVMLLLIFLFATFCSIPHYKWYLCARKMKICSFHKNKLAKSFVINLGCFLTDSDVCKESCMTYNTIAC